jgi:YHS domain-containing protein
VIFSSLIVLPNVDAKAQFTSDEESWKLTTMSNLLSMPLAFTENRGQFGEKTMFKANAGGATFYFCKDEVAYLFVRDTDELIRDEIRIRSEFEGISDEKGGPRHQKEAMLIKAQFVGANPNPEVIGINRLSHNCNYFYGNQPSNWRTNMPNYSAIIYKDIYPGIDLKYYGAGNSMKYDFIVQPGGDVLQIRIRYEGVDNLSVTPEGDLQVQTRLGLINEKAPYIYQEIGGARVEVTGRYELVEPEVFGFAIDDNFNPHYPLVIDPTLVYSTFLGGGESEHGNDIVIDGSGSAYLTGSTNSANFPTVNPYDGSHNGAWDVFVTKLSAAGDSLVYSTYLGGNNPDIGYGIVIDDSGSAYVTGETSSSDFPTVNPYDGSHNGANDVFVSRLSAAGDSLVYSTFLGGSDSDGCNSISIDGSGLAHVTGATSSSDFPTVNPYDGSHNGSVDVFVSRLSAAGDSLVYSTFLGGSELDGGYGILIDGSGNVYVTGYTRSIDFPTANPYDSSFNGGDYDAFITKFSTAGDSLIYSTFLGGSVQDGSHGIVIDGSGKVYVTGSTWSIDFPTANPYDGSHNGGADVFVSRLSAAGDSLVYSSFLGGSEDELGIGIAISGTGSIHVTGGTYSSDFPTINPYDESHNGGLDIYISRLSVAGDSLVYSTFLGGIQFEYGMAIAIDDSGCFYVTGLVDSYEFPTVNSYDSSHNGSTDVFISKFGPESGAICDYVVGDVNGSETYNGLDIIYGVNYFKIIGPAPFYECECTPGNTWYVSGDVNGDCIYNGLDVGYGVNYFKGGPMPIPCPDCPPADGVTAMMGKNINSDNLKTKAK